MAAGDGPQSARSDGGVTMQRREFLLAARLEARALEAWIEAGWLLPRENGEAGPFSEIDVARVQLIRDLGELGVNDEGIPVILDLVDQLHGLRSTLRDLLSTIGAQPAPARSQLLSGIRAAPSKRRGRP
jgi:chaperone modulatory protein CbpM